MGIQRVDVTYQLSFDLKTVQETAYCLTMCNRVDLAFDLLSNTYCSPAEARSTIQKTLAQLAEQQLAAQAAQKAVVQQAVAVQPTAADQTAVIQQTEAIHSSDASSTTDAADASSEPATSEPSETSN